MVSDYIMKWKLAREMKNRMCTYFKTYQTPYYLQLLTSDYIRLLNKPCENEVTLRGQNTCLKCYQPLELMLYF